MSKFIKIPSYQNPYEVIINGVKYQYPAGQTCMVPDEVAMVIKNVEHNAPKYAKENVRRPDIVETISGEVISVSDSVEAPLQGLKVFGKTIQKGTPTPDAPVALESVGTGGSIAVSIGDSQTISITTPNGLPGIPVSSGGNYTDAKGQQWICDEVDFEKGAYIRRVAVFSLAVKNMNNSEDYPGWRKSGIAKYYPNAGGAIGVYGATAMCNIDSNPASTVHINTTTAGDILMMPKVDGMTEPKWKERYPNLVFELMISIPTHEEITMTKEELGAYAAMHTNYPNTTVHNDAGAFMEVQYVADTKLYVDNRFNVLAAMVNNA